MRLAYRAFVLKHLKSALLAIICYVVEKFLTLHLCSLFCLKYCIALHIKKFTLKTKNCVLSTTNPPFVVVKIIVAVANEAIARLAKQQQQTRDAVVSSPYHTLEIYQNQNLNQLIFLTKLLMGRSNPRVPGS